MTYQDYFQPYQDYFWQWEDHKEVVAIPGGNTIAYRELVESVLQQLSIQGIPPFGSVLLAIMATNANGTMDIHHVRTIIAPDVERGDQSAEQAFAFLEMLSKLPSDYKLGTNRLIVLQTIFESCHNRLSARAAKRILSDYRTIRADHQQPEAKPKLKKDRYKRDLLPIALLSKNFPDVPTLLSKVSSALNVDEELKDLNSNLQQKKKDDWLQLLTDEHATRPIGVLIKHLWGALHIPLHNSLPSTQPLGGVSDLTNKGDFDKLLISEFANDDLVFLSRLANNEALYLNREVPPISNNLKRVLIIDVSIKTWGTPKTVAYAVMLAIARHPKTDIECVAFSAGNTCQPVTFNTVDDLIVSLRHVDSCLHPARGLESFIAAYKGKAEVFFISAADNMQSPEMLKLMSDHHDFFSYWIYITTRGRVSLYRRQQNNKKHVQDFQLPLEELWNQPERSKQGGPSATRLPILLKMPQIPGTMMSTADDEIYLLSTDKKLYRLYDVESKKNEKGWELVVQDLPFTSATGAMGLTDDGTHVLLVFAQKDRRILLLNLSNNDRKIFRFEVWRYAYNDFVFYDNQFYYVLRENSWAISLDGTITNSAVLPKVILENQQSRQKDLGVLQQKFFDAWKQLKNVQQLTINEKGNFVFNTHELYVNSNGIIKMDSLFSKTIIQAEKISKSNFLFADGSIIEIKSAGYFIFKSSDKKIPHIYVPAVLDSSLGIATAGAFAGNPYYYKSPRVNIFLKAVGSKPLEIVKIIKEFTGVGLKDAKALVDHAPQSVWQNASHRKAADFKFKLEQAGAIVTIESMENDPNATTEILHPTLFFERYIHPFIKTIKNGTKN
ncbi:ribosomal protein L7/L12 [Mucilaginibacter sp. CSA2-8R]|uniref:ribosomal protein L7/L12 n=1 Tax=Mucilaginibacter sp. CSA2-8R TaxID=3141542 RepID=UPI00315CA310